MNIEIKNVSLAPNYFSNMDTELQSSLASMCSKSDEHLMMITRAAWANRGKDVLTLLLHNARKIDKERASRISEIVSCGQYNDDRVCCKIKELFKTPRNRKELTVL